jgi:outer membrane protein TolC
LKETDGLKNRQTFRGWLVVALAVVATITPACAQVSLGTVVDLAQRNSTAVRIAQADVTKADAALSQSKDVLIPSLLFGTGLPVFPETGFTGSPPSIWTATVESLVFSIPQKHYIDAARLGLQAATSSLKDAREQVVLEASTAYIELDTVNRELDEARREEGFTARLVAIEQDRAEAGVDPTNDLLEARLTAAEVKLKREHLETRAGTLSKRLATLTGLPLGSIAPDRASIPEIPQVNGDAISKDLAGIEAAKFQARSKAQVAKGDDGINYYPQMSFVAQYNRNTTILNDVNNFFAHPLPANNFASGIQVEIPIFNMGHRAKARESAAEALRATVETEQAERQNEVQIAELTGSLRELDTLAEIASLKQQIADERLKSVVVQLDLGDGNSGPGATPQLTPKAEQLARIEQSQRHTESLDAGFELAKARLGLLRALGHMEDWLHELHP